MLNLSKYIQLEGDRTIWTVVFLLLMISVLVVYSVEGLLSTTSHLRNIFIGLFCMYIVHKLKFKYFSKLSLVGIIISILLLIFVYFIGKEINGAKRWIDIGSISFQPSDFAKIILLVFLSRQVSKYRDYLYNWKGFIWYLLAPILIICLLIFPSNFSTAALVFVNSCFLMMFAKLHYKFLLTIIGIPVLVFILIYFSLSSHFKSENLVKSGQWVDQISSFEDHQIMQIGSRDQCFNTECYSNRSSCWRYSLISKMPRLKTWISRVDGFFSPNKDHNKNEGYQLNESKIAIKNGGFFGKGPGKGIQRHFLYASSSDFIFAITIEQYGVLLGGIFPILLYLVFFYRSVVIAQRTESVFGSLMVASLSFALLFQALVNMAVNVGIFPVTGQTLPLISKGGTSIIFTCIAIGIILSVSRNANDRDYATA